MPKYIIEETLPCWVTWRRVVEADTEIEALRRFNEGDGAPRGAHCQPEIGDTLNGYDSGARVTGTIIKENDNDDDDEVIEPEDQTQGDVLGYDDERETP